MIAAAVSFPRSFLSNSIFIFCGETPNDFLIHFNDTQELEPHIENIRDLYGRYNSDAWDTTERIFSVLEGGIITEKDLIHFLDLGDKICHVIKYINSDDALNQLRANYPRALYRPPLKNLDK